MVNARVDIQFCESIVIFNMYLQMLGNFQHIGRSQGKQINALGNLSFDNSCLHGMLSISQKLLILRKIHVKILGNYDTFDTC